MMKRLWEAKWPQTMAAVGYALLFILFYGGKYVLEEEGLVALEYILLLAAYACLGCKVLCTQYTKWEYIVGVLLAAFGAYGLLVNKNLYLITNIVLIFSLKNVDLKRFFQKYFWVALATVAVTMSLSLIGIGGVVSITKDWGRGIVETRYVLGYGWPNTCHMYLFRLLMLYILGWYEQIRWSHILVMFALNAVLYVLTISRAGLLGVSMMLVYLTVIKMMPKVAVSKWFGGLAMVGYILVGAATLFIVFEMPGTAIYDRLNSALTGRLALAGMALQEYPVNWLGNGIGGLYIDCGWVSGLVQWGIVGMVLYHGAVLWAMAKAVCEKRPELVMVLAVTGVYGIAESSVMEKGVAAIVVVLLSILINNAQLSRK